ncbi:hypothetical protein BSZ39_05805 [Bowdeniella nasicola]|uniref:DUF4192 domain-containing protein n=1 Tax=Bowdeniella nasicola TaxID=208480 RepID=A0A1Q5Q2Q3_9ACTO|nr:DUF4192 family protein [Bowdeniella nasicola]OKL54123.1 hypothetical protein BSZ39_05805 [Bowdeniella nasicola]
MTDHGFSSLPSSRKRDLLVAASSTVPYSLGYFPADSFVVVGLTAHDTSDVVLGPLARLDIHDASAMTRREIAVSLQPLLRYRTDCCLVVGTGEDLTAAGELLEEFAAGIDHVLPVLGTVAVGDEHIVVIDDEGEHDTLTRREWETTPAVAELVVSGRALQPSSESFAFPAPSASADAPLPDDGLAAECLKAAWRQAMLGRATTTQLAALALALHAMTPRDTFIATCIRDGGSAARFEGLTPSEINDAIISGPVRSAQDFHLVFDALARIASATASGLHAEICGIGGYLAWYAGDGVRARVLVEQCLAEVPDYNLALLVNSALAVGMPPPWVDTPAAEYPTAS